MGGGGPGRRNLTLVAETVAEGGGGGGVEADRVGQIGLHQQRQLPVVVRSSHSRAETRTRTASAGLAERNSCAASNLDAMAPARGSGAASHACRSRSTAPGAELRAAATPSSRSSPGRSCAGGGSSRALLRVAGRGLGVTRAKAVCAAARRTTTVSGSAAPRPGEDAQPRRLRGRRRSKAAPPPAGASGRARTG